MHIASSVHQPGRFVVEVRTFLFANTSRISHYEASTRNIPQQPIVAAETTTSRIASSGCYGNAQGKTTLWRIDANKHRRFQATPRIRL